MKKSLFRKNYYGIEEKVPEEGNFIDEIQEIEVKVEKVEKKVKKVKKEV
jgi:tetrahydromethanopterin S-methyltransferase subunit G